MRHCLTGRIPCGGGVEPLCSSGGPAVGSRGTITVVIRLLDEEAALRGAGGSDEDSVEDVL